MTRIKGVDFSHWQAKINFAKLANNDIRFAIFKAGEIPTTSKREFTDEMYGRNIREARENGVISGAYYYFHPSISASRQARHFDAVMNRDGQPDLPPVIDTEDTDQMDPVDVAAVLKAMSDALVSRGYRTPIIYSRWGFLVNQVGEPFWIKDHLLWLAQYSNQLVNKPADMRNVVMWQYTDRLKLPGIGATLDGNYWLKSEEELLGLAKKPEPIVDQIPEISPAQTLEQPTEQLSGSIDEENFEIIPTQTPQQSMQQSPQRLPQEPQEEILEQFPQQLLEQPLEELPEVRNSPGSSRGFWEILKEIIQAFIHTRR